MIRVSANTLQRMRERNAKYVQHRMQLPITDEQYLFWDDILTNQYEEALERFQSLLARTSFFPRNCCYDTGLTTRLKLKWQDRWLFAHRFTYVVAVSLPLSSQQVVRHQCANYRCLNPAHIELGDQEQNFRDLKAAQAYGVRWELLPISPLETIK